LLEITARAGGARLGYVLHACEWYWGITEVGPIVPWARL